MSQANSRTAMFESAPVHKAFFSLAQPTADVITAAIVVTLLVKSLKKNNII